MFHSAALAAFFALCAFEPPQGMPADTEGKDAKIVSCPPVQGLTPCPVDQKDLLQNGLTVDPRAPQGVRPLEPEEMKPVPVDPGTVTLFPKEVPSKKKKGND